MLSQSSSFWKITTKLLVNGSFCGFPLFIPLLSMNKWGLAYNVSFRCVLMMKLGILSGFLRWCASLPQATHKIFKRKKKKKKKVILQVEVSRKTSFLEKILPDISAKMWTWNQKKCCCEMVWVEIFSKTRRAWTFFSWNRNLPLLSFIYYFFIFLSTEKFLLKTDLKNVDLKEGVLWKGYELSKQKKEIKFHSNYFSVLRIYTLSYDLILWVY